jgi:Putative beta-barrel porin-2, OmpL-like. bbp2
MKVWKKSMVLSAAVLAVSTVVRAENSAAQPASDLRLDRPVYLAEAEPDRRPLMDLLNRGGMAQPLENAGINIFGHIEGSYTWNFDDPEGETNFGRVFDFEHDEPTMNQLDLTVERLVDVTKKQFDIGGRMEWIWGGDSGLIHSNGLFDWYDTSRDPENQWDLNQAYLDFAVPVGNGLLIRAGKFVTLLGAETINPTTNPFFSHTYLFGYAIPFTHTGVLGSYSLNDSWSVTGGITRGWEQSNEDNNDAVDILGQVKWIANKEWTFYFNFVTGPEQPDNESDWRTVLDFILVGALTDKLSLIVNADIGWEQDVADGGTRDAQWYGIAGYLGYKLNDMATLNGRAEWFGDDDGTRTGVDANFYELTGGVALTPFHKDKWGKNFVIRPEIRVDFSDEDAFNDGSDDTMVTAAVDLIYKF